MQHQNNTHPNLPLLFQRGIRASESPVEGLLSTAVLGLPLSMFSACCGTDQSHGTVQWEGSISQGTWTARTALEMQGTLTEHSELEPSFLVLRWIFWEHGLYLNTHFWNVYKITVVLIFKLQRFIRIFSKINRSVSFNTCSKLTVLLMLIAAAKDFNIKLSDLLFVPKICEQGFTLLCFTFICWI